MATRGQPPKPNPKSVVVSVRTLPSVRNAIVAYAASENRPMASMAHVLLMEAIAARKKREK